ncbi:uncharacterized protein MONBRDRAFT_13143, partial [Monosiga brevicollis MX1]
MYLESLGLVLDEYEWILICGKCGHALNENPAQHLKRHCVNVQDADISLAMDLIKEATPRKEPVLDMNGCRPAYPCIPVQRGYRCPCCASCFSTLESLERHEQCHKGDPAITETPRKVWMQRLRKGGLGSSYVEVQYSKRSKRRRVDAQSFLSLLEAQKKKDFVVNSIRLHPVYQILGLGVLLDRLSLSQVRELGCSEVNPTLLSVMHGLLDKTYENMLCYTTAREVLGKLYTKSGDVFTARYYQKVMQHTYDRYMIVATRYVQYLLQVRRQGDEVPGRISDELAKALDDVEVAQGQNNHVMTLSEALTNVWCAVLDESTDMNSLDLEYCPTVYILCTALQANDTFKQPNNWTPTLAALLWICRLFLLVRRQLDPSSPGALTEDAAVKTRLTEGHIGYYLGSRLTYVRKCTSEEGKPGVDVVFETRPAPGQEFRTLTANGIRMNVDDLGTGLRAMRARMDEILTKELLFNSGLEKRVYAVLPLLLDSNQPGPPQSWVSRDLKDIDGHDFYTMLLEHILETPELVEEFTMPDAPGKFSIEPVWRWICSLREFNRLALTYAHLSTAPEMSSSPETAWRLSRDEAKPTTWISNRESHAAHYMDKRASAVMMAYLLLCKPLEELFANYLQDRDELITSEAIDPNSLTEEEQDELEADAMEVEDSIEPDTVGSVDDQHDDLRAAKRVAQEGTYELLFNIAPMQLEKQLRPGQVYRTIQAVTKRFLGTSITVSAWRHMSVAWLRTLVLHHTPEPSLGALNVAHSQSQHAGRTARNVYGRTQLGHKFVSSEAQYGHQFVSEEWHKLMKLVDVENQIQAEAVDGQTCVQQVVHKQVVVQSSRVRNASTQVQATVGTQTDLEVEACLDAEDDIDDIIAGLDLDEAEAAGSSMPVAVPRAVEEAASTALQQEPSQHNDQTQQEEYEDQLWLAQCVRQAWKTTFRDWDQYRLAQAVTRHEAQDGWLLAVAPTGMGKTLCTLAHLQPRKVVVWVVPLRELARDLCRRFEQADIVSQSAKNDGRDMQVNVQVIVMTVDFLVGYGM